VKEFSFRRDPHPATQLKKFAEISISPSRASSLAGLEAACCRSQALYFFVNRLNFLVELHDLRFFERIVAAQLVEHFADGEQIYFSQPNLLCATRRT
jgi:hypothetical protein